MHSPVLTVPPSGGQYFTNRRRRSPPHRNRVWTRVYEQLLGSYERPESMIQTMRDFDTSYGRRQGTDVTQDWIGQGLPAAGFRQNRYLDPAFGAGGNKQ
jgi:hypothetical protein